MAHIFVAATVNGIPKSVVTREQGKEIKEKVIAKLNESIERDGWDPRAPEIDSSLYMVCPQPTSIIDGVHIVENSGWYVIKAFREVLGISRYPCELERRVDGFVVGKDGVEHKSTDDAEIR